MDTTTQERLVQALIRFVVSGVLALIAFFVANATVLSGILLDAGTDPVYASIVVAIFVALLNSIAKFIGGATQAAQVTVGRGLSEGKRPNPFAL